MDYTSSGPYPLDGPTRSLSSRQHGSPGHWGEQTSSPRTGGSPRGGLHSLSNLKLSLNKPTIEGVRHKVLIEVNMKITLSL
jgi:hypothetical protein